MQTMASLEPDSAAMHSIPGNNVAMIELLT